MSVIPKIVNLNKDFLHQNNYKNFKDWTNYKNHLYIGCNLSYCVLGAFKSKYTNPYSLKKYTIRISYKIL